MSHEGVLMYHKVIFGQPLPLKSMDFMKQSDRLFFG